MDHLEQRVLAAITAAPGRKAREIAVQLGVTREAVNSLLYGALRGRVRQDNVYRWYLGEQPRQERNPSTSASTHETALGRLCRYYLECISRDDVGGVSVFASSFGQLDYVELATLPIVDPAGPNPFESQGGRYLLNQIQRDRNRRVVYLGYPNRLKKIRSRKGWEGYVVEPLLLFPYEDGPSKHELPVLSEDLPQINLSAVRGLSNGGEAAAMEEAIQLANDLGFGNRIEDQPDADELLSRLQQIRPDWDWQEPIDPHHLVCNGNISQLDNPGIYNRAILVAAERSPFTKGLETELGMLQQASEAEISGTALGRWLKPQSVPASASQAPATLEVLPLNSEQRQAVQQALTNQITVITGPPGTGKSQVVTSILVNAAWRGMTVLFASKNHKAVDVVETRVNALGPRPVMLRLGANEYRAKLADYLVSLLAATATDVDQEQYKECERIQGQLREKSKVLDTEFQSLLDLRNEVDALEQHVEHAREELGPDLFGRVPKINNDKLAHTTATIRLSIDRAIKAKQPAIARLFWPFLRRRRYAALTASAAEFAQASRDLGLTMPVTMPSKQSIEEWLGYRAQLDDRVRQILDVQHYFVRLKQLSEARSIEDLSCARMQLNNEIASNSEAYWMSWLRLQPARMTPEQRKLLGDYCSILQMIVSADEQERSLGANVFKRYYQLFPKITSILPCWAVTSLAVRGKVPFEPAFFDLLVIDEASQCDIASALPLLYRARRVVVIGDPMQLRHISTLPKQQDQQFLSAHDLLEDFPGWSYSTRSLFDLASSACRSEDIVALRDHHRSHADIIEFSNDAFYEGRLRVATNYGRLHRPNPDEPAVRWIDVQGTTVRPGNGGAVNDNEAYGVVTEIERLVSQGYRGSIGVVSPFNAQATRIKELVSQHPVLGARLADMDFMSETVHKFQGDERDVMFFSPTISAHASEGALGFLRSNANLFNVAITRARASLVVVGDKAAALNSDVRYLADFASYIDNVHRRASHVIETSVASLGPEYPPVAAPERVSDWERIFYRALYQAGVRPVPQYPLEKYLLDFAVIAGNRRLNIEIDGERYHRNWDGELCRRDQIRNQRLIELGWDVMRFWVYQVRDNLDLSTARVLDWLKR